MEFLAGDALAAGIFGGDMGALEGFEDVADVGEAHASYVFEEGDEGDEFFILGVAGPGVQDDGVGGLEGGVFGGGVEDEGAGEGAVEVIEILDRQS